MSTSDETKKSFDPRSGREDFKDLLVAQREMHGMLERGMRRLWCGVLALIALVALAPGK